MDAQENPLKRPFSFVKMLEPISAMAHLLFPKSCLICEKELGRQEQHMCSFCAHDLHYTYFEKYTEPNATEQLFSGRIPIEAGFSLLYFEKNLSTQKLLHQLKYQNNPALAHWLGNEIGKRIKEHPVLSTVDLLIPTPLHPRKQFMRGYNQSELLANGIADSLKIPINTTAVSKSTFTGSQTRLNRFDRWKNVADGFKLTNSLNNSLHVALVDDVITTGATLESILQQIHQHKPELKLSVISLALAK